MAKPVIALDIDDVLVDTAAALLDDYNSKYGTALEKHHYYSKDTKVLGVSDYEIAAERLTRYVLSGAITQTQPIAEAVETLTRLGASYSFIGVTSRPSEIAALTKKWITLHFGDLIPDVIFTHFIMAAESHNQNVLTKGEVCSSIGARYMVEDHLHHAIPIAESGVTVFLIDQPWNQTDVLPANVQRVSGWREIEKILS